MTLLQALAKSEELDCAVINRKAGLKFKHDYGGLSCDFDHLPRTGWELDDTPVPISFEAEYLGSDLMANLEGETLGTVYSFKGSHVTTMPIGTKVQVTLEPKS